MSGELVTAHAPGRVNLIGDHTDTTGGFVLPMAIDLGTTVIARRGHERVVLASTELDGVAEVELGVTAPEAATPPWARFVAGVVAELRPETGIVGEAHSTIPLGRGLSSSAALEVAVALALLGPTGAAEHDRTALAQLCQRAEQRATGVPSGVMDQLASLCGVAGHALLIDCTSLAVTPIALPGDVEVVVIDSGVRRELASSAYGERTAELAAAEAVIGPLRAATLADLDRIDDPVLRRRAHHVLTENGRVHAFAGALARGDLAEAGRLMGESHASLRDDFECSTPVVDALVARTAATPGVLGARMTGGGWGGCIVALAEPGALREGEVVRAAAGATCGRGAAPSSPRTPGR